MCDLRKYFLRPPIVLLLLASAQLASGAPPMQQCDEPAQDAVRLVDVPEAFTDWVERGNVSFEFYERQPGEFPGETHFELRSKNRFHFTFDVRQSGGRRTADVRLRLEGLEIACDNKIVVPASVRGDGFWSNPLVVHEFEHVRLNCDARPKLLTEFLLKQLTRMKVQLDSEAGSDADVVRKTFDSRAEDIRKEVIRVMQGNNDYLDELTHHGTRQLKDSDAFFAELYTKENLSKYKFAYLDDVRGLLQSREYRETE